MNYSGNMPDWHQYNPPQSGISDVTPTAQNVNSGHLPFISSINSSCPTQLNNPNLNPDGLEKHQSDLQNFNPRHFQHLSTNISHGHNVTDNTPLASMVQMQNCIGHYGPSNARNPMVDNLNVSMDPRNTAMSGLNEELNYRNNQVPLHSNGPMSHLNGPNVMNMNAPHRSIGSRNTNVNPNSHTANRTGLSSSSFPPCKAPCCNPDPNYQQWEKYCSYQNNMAYRENIRTNGYQADARRFGGDFNFRKDNFDGKEILPPSMVSNAPNASDHRRNFPDFKYRKERAVTRNYPSNSGMLQSYPIQNYNYTGDYQKYSYPNIKEYPKMSNMNVPNQGMIKHQDQNFYQQKYNNKSMPYQSNGTMMSSVMSTTNHIPNSNMISSTQNTYFNSQYSRNLSTDTSHDCQHADNCQIANDNATTMMNARIQTSSMHASSHVQYQQVYQQKIAMQRFSMENHLREMTKIPGYQSHPKYKECILRYREILKLQQSVAYHGQIPSQQTSSCVSATTINTAVPPINLQFDQNGILINSNYVSDGFPRIQQVLNSQTSDNSVDKQNKQESGNASEMMNHNIRKPEQLVSQQHDNQTTVLCLKGMEQQDRYSAQKNDQNQFEVQKTGNENFNDLNTNTSDASVQQKISKEFADKPELDVRQFLANWDESEDEDGTNTNAILSDSTSVVVVGYENVNFSTKTLETLEGSKSEEITTNVIAFENPDKNNTDTVMPTQDCLTISYASAENVEITKDSTCKEITKENIVQPGSHIIQCISNGPDEVPTIHIVDNLEIGSILQVTNGQITQTLGRQDAVSFFQDNTKVQTSTLTIETDKKTDSNNESAIKCNAHLEDLSKEKYIVENSAPSEMEGRMSQISQKDNNHQEITTLPTSVKNNLDSSHDMNLKKQNSFASEESHNPDDISLPDLPTSECTPISTTLNTPIHSDNEESPERSQDLTISTNPIEIIQNSPIISFTQSPTKNEPYDHLNNEREAIKNKSMDSLENQYQTENRFKDQNNDILERDIVLGTFEFSTNISKNESIVKNGKECSLSGDTVSNIDNSRTFLNSETEKVGTTGVCMTLTSGKYELKIMSAQNVGISNKSVQEYNSSIEHRGSESQTAAIDQNASTTDKKLQILPETSTKNTYNNSTQLDEALQNITNKSDEHHNDQDNIHYEKKCTLTDFNHETTSANTINLSTNDITSISSKTMIEDNCSRKNVKSNSSILFSTKHPISNNDELQKYETSDNSEKDSSLEKNANDNKSLKIDMTELKNSWHIEVADQKKSILNDQTNPHSKKSSENTTEKSNETIIQYDKHVQNVAIYKDKSCAMKNLNKSNILCKKPRIIDNVSIDDSGERMRFLKEYRRIKHKLSNEGETQTKNKNMLEACDFAAGKICHFSSDDEQSKLQILNNKQLCQKNARFKLAEEQEKKHANTLKTFVTKNVNPDFAIQVTNVNLKLKDNKEEKESKHLEEETKNSGSLDAIKIEINVSCTERNTTEKLLHENIKNAVAETIGHLTNSISNGARSNSTNLTEVQCDKRMTCNKDDLDYSAYEKRNQSSSLTETSTYKELCKDQSNIEIVKYESLITACKNDMDETSSSFISKKKRSSSSERELMDNTYKDNGKFLKIMINE